MKKLLIPLLLIILVAAWFAYGKYQAVFDANVPDDLSNPILSIPTGSSYPDLLSILEKDGFVEDIESFKWVADKMKFSKIRPGRFKIGKGWNNRRLINHLKAGKQETVKLVFNTGRKLNDIAGKAAQFIECDSAALIAAMLDEDIILKNGFEKEDFISMFIPNTYDFYWNTNAEQFIERMAKEHNKFWSAEGRSEKAAALELSPEEIYTLASIVERETSKNDEKPTIAGLYLNRLKKGMLLQADPTVVYANNDFTIRRVLLKHLEKVSPYNTYLNEGLPPGPISVASITSIDAVLNYKKHKYLYMCAKPDNSGSHAFAKTLSAHNVNARKFQAWLSKRKVFK